MEVLSGKNFLNWSPPNYRKCPPLDLLDNNAFRGNVHRICLGKLISMGKYPSNIVKIGFKLAEIEDF